MAEIIEQYYSYNGEWVKVPTTSAALEARVVELERIVAELKAGGGSDG